MGRERDPPPGNSWIRNVADPWQDGRIIKDFELVNPHFRHDMQRNYRIRMTFPCRDQNRNCDRNRILNPCRESSSPGFCTPNMHKITSEKGSSRFKSHSVDHTCHIRKFNLRNPSKTYLLNKSLTFVLQTPSNSTFAFCNKFTSFSKIHFIL